MQEWGGGHGQVKQGGWLVAREWRWAVIVVGVRAIAVGVGVTVGGEGGVGWPLLWTWGTGVLVMVAGHWVLQRRWAGGGVVAITVGTDVGGWLWSG
jgi:hypothetical protein